jgi:hypothetical protein
LSETSGQLDRSESARDVTQPCLNLKDVLVRNGMSQQQFKTALARQGIEISEASISRTYNGKRQLTPAELKATCKIFSLPYDESSPQQTSSRRTASELDQPEQPLPNPPVSDTKLTVRDVIRRHIIVFRVTIGAVLLTIAGVTAVMIASSTDSASQSAAPRPLGTGNDLPAPVPPPGCQRYEVAAKDLALRDEYGTPLTELLRGTKVTVKNVQHPRGLQHWQVATDDGQTNWVDHRYLKPIC